MKAKHLLLAVAAAALIAAPALANESDASKNTATKMHHRHWSGMMEKMDANHDGNVSKDEWTDFHSKMFDRFDTNHDGSLSKEELKAKHREMMEKHGRWKQSHGSTSEPPASNQATPSSGKRGGADGTGGWTAQ